ncbi:unnamed protein product [Cylicostephanus goldi]|uniref:Uncharacterized protein n=1 Tax=Cylicostephanus goldi TaxID=71465 RepID=A0A3P6S1V3_CYLGO|nr:unnamed protein product [Cylicostephanus goldi]
MELPAEKGKPEHPELVTQGRSVWWIEASDNSALISQIGENQEFRRLQFEFGQNLSGNHDCGRGNWRRKRGDPRKATFDVHVIKVSKKRGTACTNQTSECMTCNMEMFKKIKPRKHCFGLFDRSKSTRRHSELAAQLHP